ncbi:MAG: hypothetical protein M3O36_06865 [Myxococcota bacterium]|nr:hypothetical protein [Myxococcota bacterium]
MNGRGVLSSLAATMAITALIGAAATMTHRSRPVPRDHADQSPVSSPAAVAPRVVDPAHAHGPEEGASARAPAAALPQAPLLDEAQLMKRLRIVEDGNPALALVLAREGNRRFPGSSDAAERAAVIVKSLALQGHLSEARGEAETMVNQYLGTPWALEVEEHTGAHPRRDQPRR